MVCAFALSVFVRLDGLAAYAVINHFIFVSKMVGYASSDALKPLVSVNWGACEYKRIYFIHSGIAFVMVFGTLLATLLYIFPDLLISIFIDSGNTEVLT
ncbi:MATE family efflux transporter [Saccharicrinis aurantiacus]|uniref:MATE family efflux transporter n=1 Tax=Saccharicrinis aurantiacus TaxID=1849719 RepID=UPI00094FD47F|nr:MATE family efflux transporter [Saccharicrinis aurantiacus]